MLHRTLTITCTQAARRKISWEIKAATLGSANRAPNPINADNCQQRGLVYSREEPAQGGTPESRRYSPEAQRDNWDNQGAAGAAGIISLFRRWRLFIALPLAPRRFALVGHPRARHSLTHRPLLPRSRVAGDDRAARRESQLPVDHVPGRVVYEWPEEPGEKYSGWEVYGQYFTCCFLLFRYSMRAGFYGSGRVIIPLVLGCSEGARVVW